MPSGRRRVLRLGIDLAALFGRVEQVPARKRRLRGLPASARSVGVISVRLTRSERMDAATPGTTTTSGTRNVESNNSIPWVVSPCSPRPSPWSPVISTAVFAASRGARLRSAVVRAPRRQDSPRHRTVTWMRLPAAAKCKARVGRKDAPTRTTAATAPGVPPSLWRDR